MPYQSVPLKLVGSTSENRSHQADNELTKNWYPQIPEGNSNSPAILLPWLGSKAFATSVGNLNRGIHVWNSTLFHVVNQTLFSVDTAGVYTTIGTVAGVDYCVFENYIVGATDLMIIAGGTSSFVYTWDGTTFTASSRVSKAVTYLNSKAIYPNSGFEFGVTGASGATTETSVGSAESSPDDIQRPYAFNQWVYMFCDTTIEPFYDKGSGSPPLARIDNAIMQKGLGGFYTVANTDKAMYFLADDSNVYQIIQSQLTKISPPSMVNTIKDLNTDNARGYTITVDGQDFYILWFSDGITWAYIEEYGEWFNLSTGTNEGDTNPYLGQGYVEIYNKKLSVDYRTADIIELDMDTYTDLGNVIQRRRVLPPFSSKDVGTPIGKRLLMSKVKFALQTGVGIVSGQGSDPQIMVEYSLDGGETWSTERWIEIGRMGKYLINAEYWEMVSFYEITFRITVSDPVFSSLHDATIEVKGAGY
jgi:hypothetical protein